ncbi:MAG: hypothetical protein R2712_10190 [Vicinamibacterales bacterium]
MKRRSTPAWRLVGFALAILAGWSMGADARQLAVSFDAGRVTLVADDIPATRVLQEWSRAGGTTVINADLLGARTLSMRLHAVPEAEALAAIFGDAAGYVARRRSGAGGASDIDLILVLAKGDVPAGTTPASVLERIVGAAENAAFEPDSLVTNLPDAAADSAEDKENRANGRDGGATPADRTPSAASSEPRPESLSNGRPEGARPGVPSTAPSPAPPPSNEPPDGRAAPPRRPPPP